MNFVSIISAIVTFIRFIPDLIKIWKEVQALLEGYQDKKEAQDKAKEIADAVKKARESKDTGALEDIFAPNAFSIKFKVEKKSLELTDDVIAQDHVEIDYHEEPVYPQNPQDYPHELEIATEPQDEQPKPSIKFSFFGLGRSNSQVIGASYTNTTRLGQTTRMGSTFFAIAFLLPFISGFACSEKPVKNQPSYKPKLYAGDSDRYGITRKQSGEFISSADPRFDDYVAMRYSALACVYETYVQNCREYKKQVVKCSDVDPDEIKEFVQGL